MAEAEVLSKLHDGSDLEEVATRQPLNTSEEQDVIEQEVREKSIDFNFEEIESKGPLSTWEGHTGRIWGICINPHGNVICSASNDDTMKTWNARSGEHMKTFTGHEGSVHCVVATSKGVAITGSGDKTIKKWIMDTATCVDTFKVALNPDSMVLTSREDSVVIDLTNYSSSNKSLEITIETMKESREFEGRMPTLSTSNQILFTTTNARKDISVYNFVTGELTKTIQYGATILRMVASHDCALIITGSTKGEIIAWNTGAGTRSQTFQGHSQCIYGLFLTRNERYLISISLDTRIKFWVVSSGDCVATIETGDRLYCGVMNPTNSRLYTGSSAKTIKEWYIYDDEEEIGAGNINGGVDDLEKLREKILQQREERLEEMERQREEIMAQSEREKENEEMVTQPEREDQETERQSAERTDEMERHAEGMESESQEREADFFIDKNNQLAIVGNSGHIVSKERLRMDPNKLALDPTKMGMKGPVYSVEEASRRYLLATDKETENYFKHLLKKELAKEGRKAYLKKLKRMKNEMKRKGKERCMENREALEKRALEQYCDSAKLLDEDFRVKRAFVWAMIYEAEDDRRDVVESLSKEDINAVIESFQGKKEEVNQIMEHKERWLTLWNNPKSGLSEYDDYDYKAYSMLIVGKSGCGKSSFVKVFGSHFDKDWDAKTGPKETTMKRTKYELYSGEVDFSVYDIPGCGTMTVKAGELGMEYIRKYCLLHFNLVIMLTDSADSEFAKQLYRDLRKQEKEVLIVRTKADVGVENMSPAEEELKQSQRKQSMMQKFQAPEEHVYLSQNRHPYGEVRALCIYALKEYVVHCFRGRRELASEMIEKLEGGTPLHGFSEDSRLDAMAIESLNAFGKLRDDMDKALKSEDFQQVKRKELIDKLFDCSDEEDSSSDDDDDDDDSGVESLDSEYWKSLASQSNASAPTVDATMHISFKITQEVKEAIPLFYATDAQEKLQELRKEKEEEWKGKSEDEQRSLRETFDNLENEIQEKQRKADLIRKALEEEHVIEDSEKVQLDEDLQKKFDEAFQKEIEAKFKAEIEADDEKRKWLLEEEDAEVKRSFIFGLIFGHDNTHIDEVREIPKGELNAHIRQIKLENLLEHKDKHHYLMKCWKFPSPSKLNFNGDPDSRHIGVFGTQGAGVSSIIHQILLKYESLDADKVDFGAAASPKDSKPKKFDDLLKSQRNVFRLFNNTFLWNLPGLGSDGAESGVNGEAYFRKYHVPWFDGVIIVMASRCCYESDLEAVRICHEWKTPFLIVRTKFDVDVGAFVDDRPEKVEELFRANKFNQREIGLCVREEMVEEFTKSLREQGFEDKVAKIYAQRLHFVDGRDRKKFKPNFPKLLKNLERMCHKVSSDQRPEKIEEQMHHHNDSHFYLVTLLERRGPEFAEIAEHLRGTGTDLNDLIEFKDADFDELEIKRDTVRNTLKEFVKRALLKIGNSPREKIDCGEWTPEQVRDHIQGFGKFCESLAEGLYQNSIPGCGLQSTHPQKILDDFAEHFTEEREGEVVPIDGLRKRNVLRKLQRLYQPSTKQMREEEEVSGAGADINAKTFGEDKMKCAAVFPVFKNRDEQKASREAWKLEKQLKESAGYGLWLCEGRNSLECEPRSVSLRDIEGFNEWMKERKYLNDIAGVYIMIIAHGYTDAESGKPKLILEDHESFDVEDWIVNVLAGTQFPVILCVSSCRILGAVGDEVGKELKPTKLDVPKNIYLSWGAATGDLASDGEFVEHWRFAIATDFNREPVEVVGFEIAIRCKGGKNYSGLDKSTGSVCKGGVWIEPGHLGPSKITGKAQKELIQSCIDFAKRALPKNVEIEIADGLRWQGVGILQGRKVAVVNDDSFAVLCFHDSTKAFQGIAYHKESESDFRDLLVHLEKVQITDGRKRFGSIQAFLEATVEHKEDASLTASNGKKKVSGGRFWTSSWYSNSFE